MSNDKHLFQFRKIDAGTDDGIFDEIIVILVNGHDGANIQSLWINGSETGRYERITFENVSVFGNIDKLWFCRDVAIPADYG